MFNFDKRKRKILKAAQGSNYVAHMISLRAELQDNSYRDISNQFLEQAVEELLDKANQLKKNVYVYDNLDYQSVVFAIGFYRNNVINMPDLPDDDFNIIKCLVNLKMLPERYIALAEYMQDNECKMRLYDFA